MFPVAFVIFRLAAKPCGGAAKPDGGVPMPITIKLQVAMSVEESGLEDALAEYGRLVHTAVQGDPSAPIQEYCP